MVGGDIRRAEGQPPPEHPYSALALTLALSGSPSWAAATTAATGDGGGDEGASVSSFVAANSSDRGATRRPSSGASLDGGSAARQGQGQGQQDGELAGLGGDSSRLWSTDSERDDDDDDDDDEDDEENEGMVMEEGDKEEEEEEEEAKERGRGPALLMEPPTVVEDTDERDTQEWLRAFESDGERSPRTDGGQSRRQTHRLSQKSSRANSH